MAEDGAPEPPPGLAGIRAALVTGGSGLVGSALIGALADAGVRVLATARSREAARVVAGSGAEPLHTDVENLGAWRPECSAADAVFHLALPRLDPPLRRAGAAHRARGAGRAAAVLADVAGGRPIVMASWGLVYGDRRGAPAVDAESATGGPALARIALAAEAPLADAGARVVRLPWVYGPTGLARGLLTGLASRRLRIVGDGSNRWALLSSDDAAGALIAAHRRPPGAYTAAEDETPTQREVVEEVCARIGARMPDHVARPLAGLAMGGAVAEALATSLSIRTGALSDAGWAPRRSWRSDLVSLARSPGPGDDAAGR